MQRITVTRALLVAGVLWVSVFAVGSSFAAHKGWRDLDSKEYTILFSPPFMGNWNPGISVGVRDRTGSRMEWLCWKNFQSHEANACITYQKQGVAFPYSRASDVPGYYNDFEEIDYNIIKGSKKIKHPMGKFDTVIFTYDLSGGKKNCVAFSSRFSARKRMVDGWYCGSVNQPISESLVEMMISTIGLKGRHEPARVSYPAIKSETSSSHQGSLSSLDDDAVCGLAISTKGGTPVWDDWSAMSRYVDEARDRGLTPQQCASLLGR